MKINKLTFDHLFKLYVAAAGYKIISNKNYRFVGILEKKSNRLIVFFPQSVIEKRGIFLVLICIYMIYVVTLQCSTACEYD